MTKYKIKEKTIILQLEENCKMEIIKESIYNKTENVSSSTD